MGVVCVGVCLTCGARCEVEHVERCKEKLVSSTEGEQNWLQGSQLYTTIYYTQLTRL